MSARRYADRRLEGGAPKEFRFKIVDSAARPALAAQLAARAYRPVYRAGEPNRCPGCGRSHWHVGRIHAECAFCEAVLPIADDGQRPEER